MHSFDAELIDRLRQGEEQAFALLMQQYSSKVLALCLRVLSDRHSAEDVAQDVFLDVLRGIQSFRGEASLSTWIYRIAMSRSLDELRRRRRRERWLPLFKAREKGEAMQDIADSAEADHPLREQEFLHAQRKILDLLPENQRIAWALSTVEGLSNPEIADVLGTSIEAVESLIYRARKRLRAELEKYL